MNILHIVRTLEPGGLERMVRELARGLRANGHRCHLACLYGPGSWFHPHEWDGVWTGGRRGGFAAVLSLCRYARKHGIELLHSHNPAPQRVAVAVGTLARIPVVHTKHGRNYPRRKHRVLQNRALAFVTRRIVAVSEATRETATRTEGIPASKVVVINNGIDVALFVPDRAGHARKDEAVIGSVGRLAPEKNYGLLLEAFAHMRRRNGGSGSAREQLLLVGDGPERPMLAAKARELGLENRVTFAGPQPDPRPFYARMDVFVLSSSTEGMPMTLLEAGACGLPAVVTDVGGCGQIVRHGKTGLVVPPGDAKALAEALSSLCANAGVRRRMGAAARTHVEYHGGLRDMVRAYEQVYASVRQPR